MTNRQRKKQVAEELEPIPEDQREQWNTLVEKGRALVKENDSTIWQLVLLTGEIQTEYGLNKVERFGDEIGLARRTVFRYRWLNKAGIDEEFINKWSGLLNYSVILEILQHTGRISAPSTNYFLDYAVEHKMSARAMRVYMLDTIAPNNEREQVGQDIKLAIQDKQDYEGFSDYVKYQLEAIAEEFPEAAETLLRTAVINTDDLEELKIKAGILSDDEEKMVRQATYQSNKIRRYYRHLQDIKGDLVDHLEAGLEGSEELRLHLTKLKDISEEILKAEEITIDIPDAKEVVWSGSAVKQ